MEQLIRRSFILATTKSVSARNYHLVSHIMSGNKVISTGFNGPSYVGHSEIHALKKLWREKQGGEAQEEELQNSCLTFLGRGRVDKR